MMSALRAHTLLDDGERDGIVQDNSFVRDNSALSATPKGLVRLLTCGSVDDGKSTLIGRLLWDFSNLHDDVRSKLLKATPDGSLRPDFSRLVDGLVAEQEQGITIDICWHYFDTPSRRIVVIDSPGHEQYTRNMATGASHADLAVVLVDARAGVKRQTRRHLAILDLAGVRDVVLAVNKMDLVDWSESRFEAIRTEFEDCASHFPGLRWTAIPVAALSGDNIARQSKAMPWYSGPTFAGYLDAFSGVGETDTSPFRMPVQMILRGTDGFRGLAGSVVSGSVRLGDVVSDVLSGRSSTVVAIRTMAGDLTSAIAGQAIVLGLADDLDVGRGGLIVGTASPVAAVASDSFEARLAWLADEPFSPSGNYLIKSVNDLTPVARLSIDARLDLDTLELLNDAACVANDVVEASLSLTRPMAFDIFGNQRATGSFLLLDALTGAVVAGGVVLKFKERIISNDAFELTWEMLDRGLCTGLSNTPEHREEFQRRATEAALLLRAAGVDVKLKLGSV